MAKFNEKTHIIKLDETVEQPDGENRITVEDDETSDGAGWPIIVLESDISTHTRGRLNSNGTDFCHIRARCWRPTGDAVTITVLR